MSRASLWRGRAAAAALMFLLPTTAMADVLVLRSFGPNAGQFRPGSRIADGARIRLQNGDRLLVLDGRSTRRIAGPTLYVAGTRRFASSELVRSWRQRVRARVQSGAVRAPTAAEAESRGNLIYQAMEESRAGRYAASEALLARVEAPGFHQRVQCRLVRNQRVYNLVAQGRGSEAAALADPCARLPVPPSLRQELATLDQDAAEMIQAATAAE